MKACRSVLPLCHQGTRGLATATPPNAGVGGMALYVPKLRVDLEDWCHWTGNSWSKIQKVVGSSFRMPSRHENIYTMAANAILRLIIQNDIDPKEIGFLGFGTESSTDNAAGAVILLGMVNMGLRQQGLPMIARSCEVPEFKHACLGGMYALKAACRFVETDRRGRKAVVVCGDIAEYERGSTGEQTQGAGTCALLVERNPAMFEVDLAHAGSSSAYRGPDFRKPFSRHFHESFAKKTKRVADFPIFTGAYSQTSYLDATAYAVEDMLDQLEVTAGHFYREEVCAILFHRPFHLMPVQAMSYMYARGLARGAHHHDELKALCQEAGVKYEDVMKEVGLEVDLFTELINASKPVDPFPATRSVAKVISKSREFTHLLQDKMSLGSRHVVHLGNLYSASLPAWIASAFDEAGEKKLPIAGQPMVAIGYGSGDAAEAIPIIPCEGWEQAAKKINLEGVLKDGVNLNKEQYEAIHDGRLEDLVVYPVLEPSNEFIITHVGQRYEPTFQDLGVEYYAYIPPVQL